jgi:hypothetical protein
MSDLLNILENHEVPIENQQLIDYLQGQLQANAQHHLEASEQDDPLLKDALEGLSMVDDKSRLNGVAGDINQHLQQRLAQQKIKRRKAGRWKDQDWILMSVITLIVLVVVCYLIIRRLHHHH